MTPFVDVRRQSPSSRFPWAWSVSVAGRVVERGKTRRTIPGVAGTEDARLRAVAAAERAARRVERT